jgi:hypothetical protein
VRDRRHDTQSADKTLICSQGESSGSRRITVDMRSKKSSMFLRDALVSLNAVLVFGFLGVGVRVFTNADTAKFILSAVFIVFIAILVLYFMLHRPIRERTDHSVFREPSFAERSSERPQMESIPDVFREQANS